jgi:hypothetical protein
MKEIVKGMVRIPRNEKGKGKREKGGGSFFQLTNKMKRDRREEMKEGIL